MKTYLSFGGGVNSTALLVKYYDDIDEAVFADTGVEHPDTYDYIDYLRDNGYGITTLTPNVEGFDNLYDFCYTKRIFPSIHHKWCTGKFKLSTIYRYLDRPSNVMIGIAYDERKRASKDWLGPKTVTPMYPLIDDRVDRQGCIDIIKDAGLCVPRKSGCWICPFQKRIELRDLRVECPDLYDRLKALEEVNKYGHRIDSKGYPIDEASYLGVQDITKY